MAKKKTAPKARVAAVDDADEAAKREAAEERAREANKARNDARIERLNAIADSSDEVKTAEDDLEPLTDEVWDQSDGSKPKKSREELIEEQELQEQEEAAELLRRAKAEGEGEDDEAEAAAKLLREQPEEQGEGDEESRVNEETGKTEYKVVVNGKTKWMTVAQMRAHAGKVDAADEYLQDASAGVKKTRTQAPSPEVEQARREARERQAAEAAAYKARLKDLYTKASMGDEEAIDQLAEIQAGLSRVTPDVLRIVDERVDARVMGRTAFDQAVEWFEDEYADELSTPRLKALAARRDKEMAEANPDLEPRERLKAVGDEIRQLRKDLGGTVSRREPAPTKLQRKQAMRQVPEAAGRERPDAEPDEVESVQDGIRALARARGQLRAIKH